MKMAVLLVGKTRFPFVSAGMEVYRKRIPGYTGLEIKVIGDSGQGRTSTGDEIADRQADALLRIIKERDTVVLLDEKGGQYSSMEFASFVSRKLAGAAGSLLFVLGGAYGFSEKMYRRMNDSISLSHMTFSHQIARLVFMEQLYRAFTIIHGEPYHLGH